MQAQGANRLRNLAFTMYHPCTSLRLLPTVRDVGTEKNRKCLPPRLANDGKVLIKKIVANSNKGKRSTRRMFVDGDAPRIAILEAMSLRGSGKLMLCFILQLGLYRARNVRCPAHTVFVFRCVHAYLCDTFERYCVNDGLLLQDA